MKPTFFIVGAPKSGSTALLHYLNQHPDVCTCAQKEIHFFGSDLAERRRRTEAEYLALFAHCAGATRIGEKSVWYLYSRAAAAEIREFAPDALIVMILRNPVDMVHSLHQHFVYMGTEPERDFEAALELDAAREQGTVARMFQPRSYRAAASYAEQVSRFVEQFGTDQVVVLLHEEFVTDPEPAYRSLCSRMGIDPGFTPSFEVVNAARAPRSRAVNRFVRRSPPTVRRAARALTTQAMREQAFKAALRLNRVPAARPPMSAALRERLRREFEADVEELGKLLDRDLDGWMPPARVER